MVGKSLEHFIALAEATEDGGLAYAEVRLLTRDEESPVIVHRVLNDQTFRSLEDARKAASKFINEELVEATEDGELVLKH
ncbi:hypothetical protein [Pseudomonas sp. GL-R-26]|uniref:hypothetical protein n=1 Tax=Pseudomonas sp. GL-R-26 TaxID=2832392 RepID=UPI001CBD2A67|nr:hypothetical protein [Pseudomonas sp. GL-R-26]